jgi:hypothetical protein
MVVTHRQNVLERLGLPENASPSVSDLAKASKVPKSALEEIARRGRNAWSHNIQSVRQVGTGLKNLNLPRSQKMSANQWSKARVYSFLDKGKTFYTADSDISKKLKLL